MKRGILLFLLIIPTVIGIGFDSYTDVDPISCLGITTFEDTGTYLSDVYVSTSGSDTSGDGSQDNPYRTLTRAAEQAVPGDIIHLAAGTYSGGLHITLEGTSANPIQIVGEGIVTFSGGSNCIQFSECKYMVVRNIKCTGGVYNGFNVDDRSNYGDPHAAEFLLFDNIEISNIGSGGNEDCLKLSGLDNFFVINSHIHDGSAGGSGIDMVGCHDGIIMDNTMENLGSNFVQAKGGTEDVTIHGNYLKSVNHRGVNMGGSTGFEYFRPPVSDMDEPFEARHIRTTSNIFIDTNSAFGYVGCDECLAANNVIYKPRNWIFRILQETTSLNGYDFVPSRHGEFVNNIIFFDDNSISTYVNIGSNTAPETFRFANNLWYADDNPSFSGANLPTTEISPIIQQDPLFVDEAGEDFHLQANSPAIGAAELIWVNVDFDGDCFDNEIGAFTASDSGSSWRFAVSGDTRSDHAKHAEVLSEIIARIPNDERVTLMNTGDITAEGSLSQWETWAGIVEPLDIDWLVTDPPEYIGTLGNHDIGTSGWLARWVNYLPAQAGVSAYHDITAEPNGLYGSAKYDNAIFIWLDSSSQPSGQNQFIEDTLSRAAADQEVVWKFVGFHHPPIPCGSKSDWSLGKEWHDDYFVPYGVDIVWLGHAHYYERTCPIIDASSKSCDENNRGNSIINTSGVIHIIAGGGGAPSYTPTCTSTCGSCPWLETGETHHHFVEVEITGTTLTARAWDADDDDLIEEFTITKEGSAPPVCMTSSEMQDIIDNWKIGSETTENLMLAVIEWKTCQ